MFKPGHRPPQVTMAAEVRAGSKNRCSRAPAFSKERSEVDFLRGDEIRAVEQAGFVGGEVEEIVSRHRGQVERRTEFAFPEGGDAQLFRCEHPS